MSDLSKIEGVYEVPLPSGTLYLSSRVTNRVKSEYESWMAGRPRRRVFDMRKRGDLDEAEFHESLVSIDTGDAAGTFDWNGPAFWKSLDSLPGLVKLIVLLARAVADKYPGQAKMDETELLPLVVDKDVQGMLALALKEVIDASPNFMCPPTKEANAR